MAVSTDHTNGSPLEDAAQQKAHHSSDSLDFREAGSLDARAASIPDSTGAPLQSAEAAKAKIASDPAEGATLGHSDESDVYAKRSVEGVSSIQKLVNAMENSDPGYVDEIVGNKPHEQESLEFRVTCPGSPVRRLRLTGSRYTFGSAEGCSIRLSDENLRPMHAVLLRDASRILVRAYSVPLQVNGIRTTEATLVVGDVLRLGQYQFELLSVKHAGLDAGIDSRVERSAPKPLHQPQATATDSRTSRFTASNAEGSAAEDVLWRERLRREVDQWRERQIDCDRRENRIDDRESDLRNRESELWSRAENLYRRESRLQSQETTNFQLYDDFSQRQQEMLSSREDARLREENFHMREIQLRDQEVQYRSQLEEATGRLHQSQQQADVAAQSVARMREQFESLNSQIEQLSHQHLEIEIREKNQREEHEELRTTLEEARDRAVEGHADSETRRRAAEERVAELEAQIVHLKTTHGSSESDQITRLSESEASAERLRQQVEELQHMVSEARSEAEVLRADYEQACSSVQQLESIVSESQGHDEDHRQDWIIETSELRSAIEKLSAEMEQANDELNQLREANQDLTRRLTEVQQERDEARQDVEARPSSEEFETLYDQLNSANEQLGEMKLDYEQTLARLLSVEQQREEERLAADRHPEDTDATPADVTPADATPADATPADATPADATWGQVGNAELDAPTSQSDQHYVNQGETDSVWSGGQGYTKEGDGQATSGPDSSTVEPNNEDSVLSASDDQPQDHTAEQQADADGETPTDPIQQRHGYKQVSLEDELRVGGELPDGEQLIDGSLASKLIQDFEFENNLTSMSHVDVDSSSNDLRQLDYTGESGDGLTYTGYSQSGSEDWPSQHEPVDADTDASLEASDLPADDSDEMVDPMQAEDAQVTAAGNDGDQLLDAASDEFADPESLSGAMGNRLEDENSDEPISGESDAHDPNPIEPAMEDTQEGHEQAGQVDVLAASNMQQPDIDDDQDTIEAYMNRLLKHVRGGSDQESSELQSDFDGDDLDSVLKEEMPEEELEPLDPDAPLIPRSQAPEREADLSAMRELANTSARIAINRSTRLQTRNTQLKGVVSLACAFGALLCGLACYVFLPGMIRFFAAGMTGIVAIVYVREAMQLFQEANYQYSAATNSFHDDESDPVLTDEFADE